LIELRAVNKHFGDQQIINNCSLSIEKSVFVSLMGKSGSGKSTLISLISGLANVNSGQIFVNGTNISNLNEEKRAEFRLKNIGIVFQDFKLIPSLSVRQNIYLAIHPREDISKQEKQLKIDELIKAVGLRGKENQICEKLSGGEKQRVAIARSLVNNPSIVLADEPTGNLDSTTAQNIIELFTSMHKKFHTTFVIATHDKEIASKTEKVYRIKDGVIENES
jgi:ABC-type lipoprotein export system ATPase subunit